MTVYNRKMFRKKGGGATGIMASGPELIKAQSGTFVNIPGGGSTLQRSGFPGLRAFGGLGQNIPSRFQMPTLEDIIGAGGQPTNTRARGNISARSLNPKTTVDRPRAVQVPDYNRGIVDIIRGEKFGGTQFGRDAVKQMSKTERDIYNQMGPFRGRDLTASEKLDDDAGESSSESAIKQGFRSLGDGVNTSISNILNKAKVAIETDSEAQKSEEDAIIGGTGKSDGRDFTEEKKEEKQTIVKPDIGNKDYGLGVVKQKKNDGSLSSNVTNDNTDINTGIVDLNKMIAKSTPGSSENIAANKKINNLIKESIKNNDVNKATEANLIASGGATPESVKEMSQEDKDKALRERINNLYGKDIGLEGDLKAMNLVMLGLRIAAGDSPNAVTNIAKGAIQQMDEIGKQVAKEQDRKDKIASIVVSETLRRESKEEDFKNQKEIKKIDQKHDISMFKMQDAAQIKRDVTKMNFQVLMQDKSNLHSLGLKKIDYKMHGERLQQSMNMKIMEIESAEKRTLAQIQASADQLKFKQISAKQHAENMFKLNKDLELEKTMLSNMPKGYVLGLMEGKKKGLKDKALIDYAAEQGSKFAKARVLTGSETLKGSLFGIVEAQVKDGISVDKALESTLNNPKFQELHKNELMKLGLYKQPTAQGGNTLSSLGLPNYEEGTELGQDGKPYTGTGDKFIVGPGGTIRKG